MRGALLNPVGRLAGGREEKTQGGGEEREVGEEEKGGDEALKSWKALSKYKTL